MNILFILRCTVVAGHIIPYNQVWLNMRGKNKHVVLHSWKTVNTKRLRGFVSDTCLYTSLSGAFLGHSSCLVNKPFGLQSVTSPFVFTVQSWWLLCGCGFEQWSARQWKHQHQRRKGKHKNQNQKDLQQQQPKKQRQRAKLKLLLVQSQGRRRSRNQSQRSESVEMVH